MANDNESKKGQGAPSVAPDKPKTQATATEAPAQDVASLAPTGVDDIDLLAPEEPVAVVRSVSAVRIKHGTYIGDGCPNPVRRKRAEDVGFGYTHEHPAQPGEAVKLQDGALGQKLAQTLIKSGVATAIG